MHECKGEKFFLIFYMYCFKGTSFCGYVWVSAFILTFAFLMLTTCSFCLFFFLEASFLKTKKLLSFFSLHVVFLLIQYIALSCTYLTPRKAKSLQKRGCHFLIVYAVCPLFWHLPFLMLTTCSFGVFFFLEASFLKTKKLLSFFSLHVVFWVTAVL